MDFDEERVAKQRKIQSERFMAATPLERRLGLFKIFKSMRVGDYPHILICAEDQFALARKFLKGAVSEYNTETARSYEKIKVFEENFNLLFRKVPISDLTDDSVHGVYPL